MTMQLPCSRSLHDTTGAFPAACLLPPHTVVCGKGVSALLFVLHQVEVKLRLPGPEAHQKLEQLLAPGRVATHQQVLFQAEKHTLTCLQHTKHALACLQLHRWCWAAARPVE